MTSDEIKIIAEVVGGDKTYSHFVKRINKEFETAEVEHTSQVKTIFENLNDQIIGFCLLGASPSKMSVWNEIFIEEGWVDKNFKIESDSFELMYMYIKPEFRNKGYGKNLLQKAFDYAKNRSAGQMFAYVSDNSESSLSFYRSMNANTIADLSDGEITTAFINWKLS